MKKLVALILCGLIFTPAFAKFKTDSLLACLNKAIDNRAIFDSAKNAKINLLKENLNSLNDNNSEFTFNTYLKICKEYESYIFDSAFKYTIDLQGIAFQQNDNLKIAIAKIEMGFILLSSGMLHEALDTLKTIDTSPLDIGQKMQYYSAMARAYSDLDKFNNNEIYSPQYNNIIKLYIDSTLSLCEEGSIGYLQVAGIKYLRNSDFFKARENYEQLLKNFELDVHNTAMTKSILSNIYTKTGQNDEALQYMIESAIADIKASVKETVAMKELAQQLFKLGLVEEAYRYIKIAIEDATFYNARHRKEDLASILPIIENQAMRTIERQKKKLLHYSTIATILSILVVSILVILYKQYRGLKQVKETLSEINNKLSEANKIKEAYIAYYFNINTEYLSKVEKFKRSINQKIAVNSIVGIDNIVKNLDLKKERDDLFLNFDRVFINLFPSFINDFNLLFNEEDRIILHKEQGFPPNLRIFALIRLGITDNEKISKILNFSVNTVYSYKTKTKNKSIVSNDDFEKSIMAISSI